MQHRHLTRNITTSISGVEPPQEAFKVELILPRSCFLLNSNCFWHPHERCKNCRIQRDARSWVQWTHLCTKGDQALRAHTQACGSLPSQPSEVPQAPARSVVDWCSRAAESQARTGASLVVHREHYGDQGTHHKQVLRPGKRGPNLQTLGGTAETAC